MIAGIEPRLGYGVITSEGATIIPFHEVRIVRCCIDAELFIASGERGNVLRGIIENMFEQDYMKRVYILEVGPG